MLSDRDRRALNALEQQLAKDDPEFAERLRRREPAPGWGWVYSTVLVFAAVLSVVLVVAGALGAAFAVALIAVAAGMARASRARRGFD